MPTKVSTIIVLLLAAGLAARYSIANEANVESNIIFPHNTRHSHSLHAEGAIRGIENNRNTTALSEDCPSLHENMDTYTQTSFLYRLLHPCRYDSFALPDLEEPLNVYLQIDIDHIEAEESFLFKMHLKITFTYYDARLSYHKISPNRGSILGEKNLIDKVWTPHIYLPNEKASNVMGLGKKDVSIIINPSGQIIFSQRLSISTYCWMNLKKFPFDEQSCNMYFQTWSHDATKLRLRWNSQNPVIVADQLYLTEFTWNGYEISEINNMTFLNPKNDHVGNHSAILFRFRVVREIGYYLLDYFIPSILLVITSWVTFWLQADATPARTILGTSTMLAFITLAVGQSKSLPKVSYITASEIWFLGCVAFIFLSLVEFAFSNVIWRRKKQVELKKLKGKYILKSALTPRLARRDLLKDWNYTNNLHKSQSSSSLASSSDETTYPKATYNNTDNHSYQKNSRSISVPSKQGQNEDTITEDETHDTLSIPVPVRIPESPQPPSCTYTCLSPQEVSMWIDRKSRFLFPCAFLIFNIFYWTFVYLL